jgi:hypothetical protein
MVAPTTSDIIGPTNVVIMQLPSLAMSAPQAVG